MTAKLAQMAGKVANRDLNECLDRISDALAAFKWLAECPEEMRAEVADRLTNNLHDALGHGRDAKSWVEEIAKG